MSLRVPLVRQALIAAITLCGLAAPTASMAQATSERPAVLNQIVDCRHQTDPAQRLACYDRAVGAFDDAERQGEVVVVDRAQVRETRRGLFGFDLPTMPDFLTRGETQEPLEAIETTLARASQISESRWTFTLADGSVWRQVDSERVRFRNREGVPVRIRRAALGSYLMVIDNSRAVRVRRQ